MSRSQKGLIYILITVTGYSFLPIFANHLRAEGMAPLEQAFWRYFFAAPIFWVLVGAPLLKRRKQADQPNEITPSKRLPYWGLLLVGFSLAAEGLAAFIGLQFISPGVYLVLFYTYPSITAIFSMFLGERLSMVGWIALGITLIGVALTAANFTLALDQQQMIGAAFALLNAVGAAFYFVMMDRLMRGNSNTVGASAVTVTGALIFLTVIALAQGVQAPQTSNAWLNLLGLVIISTVIPVFTMNKGIQAAGPTRAAIFGTIEPLLTAILAQVILGDTMQSMQWIGGALVVFSVILLQIRGSAPITDAQTVPVKV